MIPFDPLSIKPPTDRPWGINLGGGTNSTALVIECYNRGHRPAWILFADTGSEREETYAALTRLAAWSDSRKFTPINTTRWNRMKPLPNGKTFETLEEMCLRTGYLPSKAYGYAGCSDKYKRQPAERWRAERGLESTVYALGFDAGEHKRVRSPGCARVEGAQEEPWYPLYAWGIDRAACERIITEAGLPPVPKSACFFCPNMKAHEWRTMKQERPDLFARSLAIEDGAIRAGHADTKGLRRSSGFLHNLPMFANDAPESAGLSCDCFESELPS